MGDKRSNVATPLAPEDIRRDQYVAVLDELHQFLPLRCVDEPDLHPPKPLSARFLPFYVEPLTVIDVCLPFVAVRCPEGCVTMLDVRRCRLGRLRGRFARRVLRQSRRRRGGP